MILCQQLHDWASIMDGDKENGQGGNGSNGDPRTSVGLPSLNADVEESGSAEKRRWTFTPGKQPNQPGGDKTAAPKRATGHEVSFLSACA